jgi:4-alpha-glucanotransferase
LTPQNSSPLPPALLAEAAERCHIEPEYWDTWGQRHTPSAEAIGAIARSLGGGAGVEEFLAGRARAEWDRMIPATQVLTEGQPLRIAVRMPAALARHRATFAIVFEHGERASLSWQMPAGAEAHDVHGQRFLEAYFEPAIHPAAGYHEITIEADARTDRMRLIVAPQRAYLPPFLAQGGKTAGVAVSLYGVRSERNWGCGDFTDLHALLEWLAKDLGATFLALNPLHAIENRQPYNISPYLPTSVFFRNPLYLDVEAVPDVRESAGAQRLLRSAAVRAEIEACREAEFVEYERVWRLKRFFLLLGYRQFRKTGRGDSFRRYLAGQGLLLRRYGAYCAIWDWMHKRNRDAWIWQHWPEAYQDPDSAEVAEFCRRHERQILFHCYLQWLVDEQLAAAQARSAELGMPIGLYHDMALATDRCGADLWANRRFFVPGCRVGSPPDGFAPEGQDWAFPPPDTLRNRDDGYRMFIDGIRASSRHGGALRIDHVMRLFRLFWIPEGLEAKNGAYVRDFHEDLLRVLALESVRGRFLVVGEDLGTVGGNMRELLYRAGILSYKVLYFEKDQQGNFLRPEQYAPHALVSSTTHDLPTLAGYWIHRDIEARRAAGLLPDEASYHRQRQERDADKQRLLNLLHELGLLPEWVERDAQRIPELTGELHNAIIGFLARTPSMLMVLNQEDLTKETEQQNLPASTWQYPNWKRKMKYTCQELRTLKITRDFASMLQGWLESSGRLGRQS